MVCLIGAEGSPDGYLSAGFLAMFQVTETQKFHKSGGKKGTHVYIPFGMLVGRTVVCF
jgi:hypothetical protein